jgi:hypothetical protein
MSGKFDNPFDRPIVGTPLTPEAHLEMDQDMQVLLQMQMQKDLHQLAHPEEAEQPAKPIGLLTILKSIF